MSRRRIELATRRWALWLEPQRARLLSQPGWPAANTGGWAVHGDISLPAVHDPQWGGAIRTLLKGGPAASWRRLDVVLCGSLAALLPLSLGPRRLPRPVRQAFAEARVHEWFHEPAGTWQVRLPRAVMYGDTVVSAVRQPVLQAVLEATQTLQRAASVQPAAWWGAHQLRAGARGIEPAGVDGWTLLGEADRCSGVLWQGGQPVHCVLLPALAEAQPPGAAWWQALDAWEGRVLGASALRPRVVLARLDASSGMPLQVPSREAHSVGLLALLEQPVVARASVAAHVASAS